MAATKDTNMQQDRKKALENAMKQITKEFGAGSIMRLGEMGDKLDIEVIPTGSLALDIAVGVGGYPRGRVIEIYGPESSGKTTLALHAIAEAQKMGGVTAFIDAEHALDPVYAHHLGVDTKELLISQPDSGEDALSITETLIRSNVIDVIIVDSVAALVPKAELDGEMGDKFVGLQARMMSQAMRKLTGAIAKTKTCVIFINQIREKVGVMFGNTETTTGGRALKFFASMRIDLRKTETLKNTDDVPTGNMVTAKVVKNKMAAPFRKAEFELNYNEGISRTGEVIDLGVTCKFVDKKGSWFQYGDTKIGQGREAAKQFLVDHKDVMQEIEDKIKAFYSEKK